MSKALSTELGAFREALGEFRRDDLEEQLPLLHALLQRHYNAVPAVDIERARWVTRSLRQTEASGAPMSIRRAKAVASYLAKREIRFHDDNLLGGATTSKEVGAAVYPELFGLSIWPELDTIGGRPENPLALTDEEAEILNFEVYPYWMSRTAVEGVRRVDPKRQALLEKLVLFSISKAVTLSHCTPGYGLVLEKGLDGIIEDAADQQAVAGSDKERAFYQSMQIAMHGLKRYAERISDTAADLAAKETDPHRADTLRSIAAVTRRVPTSPPTSYREALNAIVLCQVGVLAENVNMAINPGRLDQLLYPYFIEEYRAGTLSIREALTLTGCLWLKLADNVNLVPEASERLFGGAGAVPAITIGGIDGDGNDAVNALTFLMLKVTELLPIRDPNVNARFHPDENPVEYRDDVARVILSTKAIPAMYNDLENIPALGRQLGEGNEAHARDYAVIGCVELGSPGRDFSASSSIFMMMNTVLYMALHDGRTQATGDDRIGAATGNPAGFDSFDDLWNAYVAQTRWMVANTVALNNTYGRVHQAQLPTPLLSCFFEGPMASGRDLIDGGARYNSSGVTHIGFADVCDSLSAIEEVCFNPENTRMHRSLDELVHAVDTNFEGEDALRAYLENRAPKFGTDHPTAVKNAARLIELEYECFANAQNYRGGNYRTAYWTMTNHAGYGYVFGALPSGRTAGKPFSSGLTPASQIHTQLTSALDAVARLDSEQIPGAYALNIKLSPMPPSPQNAEKLGAMIEAYMRNGGQQVQFNIHDYDTLKAAQDAPEEYPHLVVRVSGYSAYFEALNRVMQGELIERSQYDLDSGQLVTLT